jgi:hypothetical protein
MDQPSKPEWFLMQEVRNRTLSAAVWIPLRQMETIVHVGEKHKVGEWEEILYVGSVAFYPKFKALAETYGSSALGISHAGKPYAFGDGRYKPVDVYMHDDENVVGVELIFEQQLNRDHPTKWIINPDLTMALGLIEEGDSWLRVDEGYAEVLRSRRDKVGHIVAIEIKSEYLRDYLAARGLALRVSQYRERMAILSDTSHLPWEVGASRVEGDQPDRFELRVLETDVSDNPFGGSSVSVHQSWRTDVDNEEDVPVFGAGNEGNTAGDLATIDIPGEKAYRVEGAHWREEWIEPLDRSIRVRGDKPEEEFYYSIDAGGERSIGSKLNHEEIGRYLWFRPSVISALLQIRGAGLKWYTEQTGSVWCSTSFRTHFGVNREGFVNVYAYDVAKLPQWQQRIWSGHNTTPEGPVATELLDAQQRCKPAGTKAPEVQFENLLKEIHEVFTFRYGSPLFRPHKNSAAVLKSVHRFRSLDTNGFLELAKDIARLTADSIDVGVLAKIIAPPKQEQWRSLRHLEKALEILLIQKRLAQHLGVWWVFMS